MMRHPEISIIVPAYNAERYIRTCINSVVRQSFADWELIIIDDGSTDRTYKICRTYAKQDDRIQVKHQENEGVSAARNAGLDIAKGRYVAFLDADDAMTVRSLEIRYYMMTNGYDMVLGAIKGIRKIHAMLAHRPKVWDKKQSIQNVMVPGESGYQGYLGNKMFRNDMIQKNHIRFDTTIAYNEDRLFCVTYLLCSKGRTRLTNQLVYRYRKNESGAMRSMKKMTDKDYDKIMSEFKAFDLIAEMVKAYDMELYYLCLVDAQVRSSFVLRHLLIGRPKVTRALRENIRRYGGEAMKAERGVIPPMKLIKLWIHTSFVI